MDISVREDNCIVDDLNEQIDKIFVHLRRIESVDAKKEDTLLMECAIENFVISVTRRLDEEEKLLRNNYSAEVVNHLEQHRFFASQVNLLKIAIFAGQLTLARSVVAFLRTWLNYHIFHEGPDYMALASNS